MVNSMHPLEDTPLVGAYLSAYLFSNSKAITLFEYYQVYTRM